MIDLREEEGGGGRREEGTIVKPGSSAFQSDALTNELLKLWHWSRG